MDRSAIAQLTAHQSTLSLSEIIAAGRAGLFGLLYVLQKREAHEGAGLSFFIEQFVEFLQFMLFVVNHRAHFAWTTTISPLQYAAHFSVPAGYYEVAHSPSFYLALLFLAGLWAFVFLAIALWAVFEFANARIPPMQALYTLRTIASYSASVGFIPVFEVLVSTISCSHHEHFVPDEYFLSLGFECFAGAHLAILIVAYLLAFAFAIFVGVFTFVFVDSNPLSSGLKGASSGRSALAMLLWKVVLILLIEAIPEYLGTTACSAVVVIAGALWMLNILWYMPATTHAMNQLQLAFAAIFTFTAVSACVGAGVPTYDAAILAYGGFIPAAVTGIFLANVRRNFVTHRNPNDLGSPAEVDLWVRYTISDALDAVLKEGARADQERAQAAGGRREVPEGHPALPAGTAAVGMGCPVGGGGGGGGGESEGEGPVGGLSPQLYAAMDVDERTAVVHRHLPPALLLYAEAVLQDAAMRFPRSSLLQLFIARFYQVYSGEPWRAMGHLMRALRLGAPLDVAFVVYAARRVADSQAGNDVDNTITRLGFEKAMKDARVETGRAVAAQAALFHEMCESTPHMAALHKHAIALSVAAAAAEKAFGIIFAINAQSVSALRLFTLYNDMVANNPDKAEVVAAEADRLDEMAQKAQAQAGQQGVSGARTLLHQPSEAQVIASETTGVVSISAFPQTLGQITYASQAACRVLGYSRAQLEHRNVSAIVPSPMAEAHNSFLERYLQTGRSSTIDRTRTMLAKHRLGHLIPVQVRLRDVPPGEAGTTAYTLMALIRPVQELGGGTGAPGEAGSTPVVPEEFLLIDGGGAVRGATLNALVTLGVAPDELLAATVLLSDVIPGWAASVDAANSPAGAVVHLQALRGSVASIPKVAAHTAGDDDQAVSREDALASIFGPTRGATRIVRAWIQHIPAGGGTVPISILSYRALAPVIHSAEALEGMIADLMPGDDGGSDDGVSSRGGGGATSRRGSDGGDSEGGGLDSGRVRRDLRDDPFSAEALGRGAKGSAAGLGQPPIVAPNAPAAPAAARRASIPASGPPVVLEAIPSAAEADSRADVTGVVTSTMSDTAAADSAIVASPALPPSPEATPSDRPAAGSPDAEDDRGAPKPLSMSRRRPSGGALKQGPPVLKQGSSGATGASPLPQAMARRMSQGKLGGPAPIIRRNSQAGGLLHSVVSRRNMAGKIVSVAPKDFKELAQGVVIAQQLSSVMSMANLRRDSNATGARGARSEAPGLSRRGSATAMKDLPRRNSVGSAGGGSRRLGAEGGSIRFGGEDSSAKYGGGGVGGSVKYGGGSVGKYGGGAGGSVNSRGTAGKKTMTRLRRALVDQSTAKRGFHRALWWLWWAIVALITMNAVLATVQAVILGVIFNEFATDIGLSHATSATTFGLFPMVERIQICMLETAGIITADNSSVMIEDREKLPELVSHLRSELIDLEAALVKAKDPQGLSAKSNVVLANFDNAAIVRAGIDINETDTAAKPLVDEDPAFDGATSFLGPYGLEGDDMLLASQTRGTVVQGAWALYAAANKIAVAARDDTSASELRDAASTAGLVDESDVHGPVICSGQAFAPWMFIQNAMSGAQFHEHLQATIGFAYETVREARTGLINQSLVILVVMLTTIAVSGVLIILPNLYAVRKLQDYLLLRLLKLPPMVLRFLALQADRRVIGLRRQGDVGTVGAADVPDEASEGEEGEEGEGGVGDAEVAALLAGGNGGGEEAGDPTEGVDWALVLEKVQSMGGGAPDDSRTESEGAAGASLLSGRGCTGNRAAWFLPPGLLVFLLPCVALIPFYVSIYQTSTTAVADVLSTQAYFTVSVLRSGYIHETLMDVISAVSGVGFEAPVQSFISSTWQTLVDLQSHTAILAFNSVGTTRPIGTGEGGNPDPSEFEAPLTASELAGVPGIDSGTTAAISTAMLKDACPLVVAQTGISMSRCRAIADGALSSGLVNAVAVYVNIAERILQAKSDQVAAARALGVQVPREGFGYSMADAFANPQYAEMRELGNVALQPVFKYIADLYIEAAQSRSAKQSAFVVNFTVGFTIAFTFLVTLSLVPRIAVLERQLRQRQSLLLLLPTELVYGLPTVKELVLEVVAEAEGGEAGAKAARAAAKQAMTRLSGTRRFSIAGGLT